MKKILDDIVKYKKRYVQEQKLHTTVSVLEKQIANHTRPFFSLKKNIQSAINSISIIAEYKTKSPSKGIINNQALVEEVVQGYYEYGAAGVSILTDQNYFGGNDQHIVNVNSIPIPILRKDFIVDDYQVFESKALGANCILLIATCLSIQEVKHFSKLAKELHLEVLLELHQEKDLECINEYVDLVGINNRNLQTFEIDLEHSFRLLNKIPSSFIRVSESGIHTPKDVVVLKNAGFDAFLIGESFMKTPQPSLTFKAFLKACNEFIN